MKKKVKNTISHAFSIALLMTISGNPTPEDLALHAAIEFAFHHILNLIFSFWPDSQGE